MEIKNKQLTICALIAAIFYFSASAEVAGASIDILSGLLYGTTTANNFSLSDDFSSDYYINASLSQCKLEDGKVYAADNSISSRVVSQQMGYSSYNIGSAKLEVSDFTPSGGRIVYFLSNDNGQTWIEAQLGKFVSFGTSGKMMRWSAVIARSSQDAPSPYIDSVTISFKYGYDSDLYQANDNKRISDLSTVAGALSDFYEDYGTYPHASGTGASGWNELMSVLSRNQKGGQENYPYLWSTLNDPLHDSDENTTYTYKDLSQNEYILTASFQSQDDYAAAGGFRGTYGETTCSYPTYCVGVVHGASSSSGGQVLGISTTSTVYNSTYTSIATTNMNLDNMIANPLNGILGYEAFRFGDYPWASGTTGNTKTVTQSSSSGGSGTVAGTSISKVAGVATGTKGSLALSLGLSALITLMYAGYIKTGVSTRYGIWAVIRKHRSEFHQLLKTVPVDR
jgi:hypothetical protein